MSPPHSRFFSILSPIALFVLNVHLCWRLFFTEHVAYLFSVEPVFYAIARGIRDRWPALGWWNQSNMGYPFEYSYQPLLHSVTALLAGLTDWPEARAYHFALGAVYSLGPVALFYLTRRLTQSNSAGFAAGLLYSLVSPAAILLSPIRGDLGGTWFLRRLHVAVVYGDGPNVTGLTLVPFALLFLHRALERRTVLRWAAASIAMAGVALTNVPATMALAMAVVSYGLSFPPQRWHVRWLQIGGIAITGFLLFAPWLPPSGLAVNAANVRLMNPEGSFSAEKIPYLVAVAAAIAVVLGVSRWRRIRQELRFCWAFALLIGSVAAVSILGGVDLVGQAQRFHVAMEQAIILAVVVTAYFAIPWTRATKFISGAALAAFLLFVYPQARQFCRELIVSAEIENLSEYKIASWMREHAKGDRVLVVGATSFWHSYLTDTPQVKGCCDQNSLLPAMRHVFPAIAATPGTGSVETDPSIRWMQVLGVHYVAVSGPGSTDIYKDFAYPEKYRGVLKEVWREGDDTIYEVPLGSASLAHAVPEAALLKSDFANASYDGELDVYRTALLTDRGSGLRWSSSSEVVISGRVHAGEVYSVQIPFHPGWHAQAGDRPVPITKDGLGFQVLHPECDGACEVALRFDGGRERALLWTACLLTWLAVLFFSWRRGEWSSNASQ